MRPVPKGYVALTSSYDGSTFLLDARGLVAYPTKAHRAGAKLPDSCIVGPVTDTENYWTVAETFDEVCAKLVAALGAQECDTAAKVVEEAVAYLLRSATSMRTEAEQPLVQAIQAHLAAEGGAS